jgi:uncharacterized protein (UPF0332 family)
MTPEERKILVDRQVEKSKHFLAQADEMMSLGHSDMAVNRLYYACFHVVQALFIQREVSGHTHSGMIMQFSNYFVRTGIVAMEDGSLLARLFQLRQKADYNCAYDISEDEAKSLMEPVHGFVEKIVEIINGFDNINLKNVE